MSDESKHINTAANELSKVYDLDLMQEEDTVDRQLIISRLQEKVEELVNTDMDQFIQLLYMIDVAEKGIMEIMANEAVEDRTRLIATTILDRQLQKIKTKAAYKSPPTTEDEEEKW